MRVVRMTLMSRKLLLFEVAVELVIEDQLCETGFFVRRV